MRGDPFSPFSPSRRTDAGGIRRGREATVRTREIGRRQALGARSCDVSSHFGIGAVVLTLLGALAGFGAAPAISGLPGWRAPVSLLAVLAAFGSAAAIGALSGFHRAHQASRLDPIEGFE